MSPEALERVVELRGNCKTYRQIMRAMGEEFNLWYSEAHWRKFCKGRGIEPDWESAEARAEHLRDLGLTFRGIAIVMCEYHDVDRTWAGWHWRLNRKRQVMAA